MIKKLKSSLMIASITCLLSGLGCASEGMQVKVNQGASNFSFALDANPTTGYQWKIDSLDQQQVILLSSDYQASKPLLVGSGGQQVFKFKVVNPSKNLDTKIKLSYARAWEKSPVKTQLVHVYYGK